MVQSEHDIETQHKVSKYKNVNKIMSEQEDVKKSFLTTELRQALLGIVKASVSLKETIKKFEEIVKK